MKKRKLSSILLAGVLSLLFSFPAVAGDIGPSASGEPTNQARIIAGVINARKLVYWSVWTDRAAAYARDPKNKPAPTWPTATEIKNQVGGETPEGFTFTETAMPAGRDNSFRLVITVASSRGGAAAAEKVTMFLPMASVSGTKITIPVTRPAPALGAETLMSEYVRRDGSTPDGLSTVFSGREISFGENARVHFQGAGGNIENANFVAAKELQLTSGAGAKIQIAGNGIPRYQPLNRSSWYSFVTAENIAEQAVSSAGKFTTARKIALSGGAIAAGVAFDGTKDITLNVTSLNANMLTGRIVADFARNAQFADYAEKAREAENAALANHANHADFAAKAQNASYSNNSGYSAVANFANNAGNANFADIAGYSTNANYATSAGSASSAGTVGGYTVAQILAAAQAQGGAVSGNAVAWKGLPGPYLPGNSSQTYAIFGSYFHSAHGKFEHDNDARGSYVVAISGGARIDDVSPLSWQDRFISCPSTSHRAIYIRTK